METLLYIILGLIPLGVLVLIIYVIITLLLRRNKGNMNYGNSSLNILDNDTAHEDDDMNQTNEKGL